MIPELGTTVDWLPISLKSGERKLSEVTVGGECLLGQKTSTTLNLEDETGQSTDTLAEILFLTHS